MAAPAGLQALDMNLVVAKLPSGLSVAEITEKCTALAINDSPAEMNIPRVKRIDPPSNAPDSPTRISQSRAMPRPASTANSVHHSRSASRSTAQSRPTSRRSSLHSSRRSAINPSIVTMPARNTQPVEKRESLLALHRESCRLFQDQESAIYSEESRPASLYRSGSSYKPRRESNHSSDISTPPSPIASSQSSRVADFDRCSSISSVTRPHLQTRDRSNTMPYGTVAHNLSPTASSVHVPATVMEWTSPSTRRREYEKIDRAGRGVRGLWRRVAPRWCQTEDTRTPFFEEGKTTREGSIRRFRMDLPDEEEIGSQEKPHVQFLDFRSKNASQDGSSRRLWSGRRSKTCI